MEYVFTSFFLAKAPQKNIVKYRHDPVPHTSCFRPSRGCLRHMRTTQERRWSFAYPEFVRGKRTAPNIPNAWDDDFRPWPKSWKDCTKKRKQWM